jgi:Flp pilus assembly secretin CpaC
MANPNLVNTNTIFGGTAYIIPSVTTAGQVAWLYNGTTAITGLTPAVNSINKINLLIATNVSASAVSATVSVSSNATWASGVPYYIAFQISIPAGAAVVLLDKTSPLYIMESQSLGVQSGTASAINFVASFETLT